MRREKKEKKILIIDDNKNALKTTQDILQTAGYESSVLSNPMQTEEYIEKEKPDLLIIDMLMPDRGGFNILEDFRVRNVYQEIPKIFLTAFDNQIDRIIAGAYGIKDYIVKPVDPEGLIAKIEKLIG